MSVTDVYANGFDEENEKTISATDCPECAGWIRTENGEISCTECGLIVNEYWIDHGPERTIDDGLERTGAPLTMTRHDRGLSTEIGCVCVVPTPGRPRRWRRWRGVRGRRSSWDTRC